MILVMILKNRIEKIKSGRLPFRLINLISNSFLHAVTKPVRETPWVFYCH